MNLAFSREWKIKACGTSVFRSELCFRELLPGHGREAGLRPLGRDVRPRRGVGLRPREARLGGERRRAQAVQGQDGPRRRGPRRLSLGNEPVGPVEGHLKLKGHDEMFGFIALKFAKILQTRLIIKDDTEHEVRLQSLFEDV